MIMKSFLLLAAFICVLTLSSSSVPSVTNAAGVARFQRAEMNFASPVELMGVTLKGDYLFVHDDEAMARGDACTLVYKGFNEKPKNLVTTFHCMPAARNKVDYFTVRTAPNELGQIELREFQFAGSSEAHLVPVHQHSAHVPLVP
jgi:hypothetical protein